MKMRATNVLLPVRLGWGEFVEYAGDAGCRFGWGEQGNLMGVAVGLNGACCSVFGVPCVDNHDVGGSGELDQAVRGNFIVQELDFDALIESLDQLCGSVPDAFGECVDGDCPAFEWVGCGRVFVGSYWLRRAKAFELLWLAEVSGE